MKSLRTLTRVSRIKRVRKEWVRRRAGIEGELASREVRKDEYRIARGIDGGSKWSASKK